MTGTPPPPTDPKLRALYDAAKRLAAAKAKRDWLAKVVEQLTFISASMWKRAATGD